MRINGVETPITRKEALRLHREMWTDMQKDLGDCPSAKDRKVYKKKWVKEHGYESVLSNCFLCEYAVNKPRARYGVNSCTFCPIDWENLCASLDDQDFGYCFADYAESYYGTQIYLFAPISEILALPERRR